MLAVVGCKDPFDPPVSSDKVGYLSVDGNINVTDSLAEVNLTRAQTLSSKEESQKVTDATVTIEDSSGNVYALANEGNGLYRLTKVVFDFQVTYRLRISTSNNKKYSSSFIPLSKTPPIDTIKWSPAEDGIGISLSSKGNGNDSPYYYWKFVETWEYHSEIPSYLKLVDGKVFPRNPDEQINVCWQTLSSDQILIQSTAGLSKNEVTDFQLTFIPVGSPKLLQRYSLLVQQYSLTKEAYNFQKQLQSTTENLGGLFDPLPFKVLGNIVNEDDPGESVLGYFYASTVSSRRIFIRYDQLPGYLRRAPESLDCKIENVPIASIPPNSNATNIIGSYGVPITLGYTFSSTACVDCRYSGGTTTRPSFW